MITKIKIIQINTLTFCVYGYFAIEKKTVAIALEKRIIKNEFGIGIVHHCLEA